MQEHTPVATHSVQERAGKNAHLPIPSWKELKYILSPQLPKNLTSNQLASR